ncbi:MAG: NAD-dependent epimerase/dehydratase family protein, partial [Myxococcales bacterium]|nr:NAD-dependent epimerase/dehydratase family protein [Myxococcales bacterium]
MPSAYVSGATGFVGLNLIERLRADGWEVHAIHRESSDLRYLSPLGATLQVADVTDAASILETMPEEVDIVFHLAGDTSLWKPRNARQEAINVDGTRHMLEAARVRRAGRFVHTSSISAFGDQGGPIHERTPSTALTSGVGYMRTKWLGQQEVRRAIEA